MSKKLPKALSKAMVLCLLFGSLLMSRKGLAETKVVSSRISKVGVEKVIRVELDGKQGSDAKSRRVRILMRVSYPRCIEGPVWYYKEGSLQDDDYYSLWAAQQDPCPKKHSEDLILIMDLQVGKKHNLVLRGPGRYDQRVSFKLEADKVSSIFIKKKVSR